MSIKRKIRETLQSLVRLKQWQLDQGYGERTLTRANAITKIKQHLDHWQYADNRAHMRMMVMLEPEIMELSPRSQRYAGMRRDIHTLLDYCKQMTGQVCAV